MKLTIVIVLLPILSGCIVLPTFERSEFREEKIAFIEPGLTTRAELEAELVHEKMLVSERRAGELVIYVDFRSTMIYADEYSSGTSGSSDYLIVEYDTEERVVWFEALKGSGSCTSTEICVRKGAEAFGADQLGLLVFAPLAEDERAKSFDVLSGTCNVHVWTRSGFMCPGEGGVRLSFEGEEPEEWTGLAPRGYVRWTIAATDSIPAETRIEATGRTNWLVEQLPSTHELQCADGTNIFVELTNKCNALGIRRGTEFRTVPNSEGREAVMDRQLILN